MTEGARVEVKVRVIVPSEGESSKGKGEGEGDIPREVLLEKLLTVISEHQSILPM